MPDALETALRDLREPASAGFAADLDARVAAGFGAPAPSARPPRPSRLRKLLLPVGGLAATAVLLFLVVNVLGSIQTGGSDAGSGGAASSDSASSSSSSSASQAAPATPSSGAAVAPRQERRSVERTAALTLTAPPDRVERAAAGISDVADRFSGYVESSSVDAGSESGTGSFVLRLPVARLDDAMAALARVGKVTNRRQTAEDITAQANRARSSLRAARAERTSLLRRLAAATTDQQTASLRARLQDADARIDRALTAVRRVDRRADFARVDVTLTSADDDTPAETDDGGAWGPGAAWDDAQRVLAVASGVAVLLLAVLAPLALLALIVLGGRRLHTARARSRVLDGV